MYSINSLINSVYSKHRFRNDQTTSDEDLHLSIRGRNRLQSAIFFSVKGLRRVTNSTASECISLPQWNLHMHMQMHILRIIAALGYRRKSSAITIILYDDALNLIFINFHRFITISSVFMKWNLTRWPHFSIHHGTPMSIVVLVVIYSESVAVSSSSLIPYITHTKSV